MTAFPWLAVIPYPAIDPVIFQVGPVVVRWYALAYIAGLVIGWRYLLKRSQKADAPMRPADADDFLLWATLGVVLGGRLGFVLFYRPAYFAAHPLEALQVWQGGMSFHGGLVGVTLAVLLFARRRGIPPLALSDMFLPVAPIGLGLGRIANFVNGELWGRVADVPWAMVFPNAGPQPRHPSQLYQAGLEGLALFLLLWWAGRRKSISAAEGAITGLFFAGYGVARVIGEQFRQPDTYIGFLAGGSTWGQWLSLPLIAVGLWLMWRTRSRR
jgi:phosphatidylglycerol:prolipoprotein diacylglycerol transferase